MANKIDLHTHTTASDGTLTPTELVAHARELGLSAVAITDHDTMNGVAEAQTAGERLGVEVIPGLEISTDYRGEDTHVLGYGMDINAPALREVLDWVIGCAATALTSHWKNWRRRIPARPLDAPILPGCWWHRGLRDRFRMPLPDFCQPESNITCHALISR